MICFRFATLSTFREKEYLHFCYFTEDAPLPRSVAPRVASSSEQVKNLFDVMEMEVFTVENISLGYDKFLLKDFCQGSWKYTVARLMNKDGVLVKCEDDYMEFDEDEWIHLMNIRKEIESFMGSIADVKDCKCKGVNRASCRRCNFFGSNNFKCK